METAAPHRFVPVLLPAIAVCTAISLSGCAVPVAPGYKIQKESLAVRFVPGDPPHLAIRAEYRLANIGNAPLEFIGVTVPGEKEFGRANLRAKVDGKEIAPQHNPLEAADDWRIPLPIPWRQKRKINLSLSYDLAAQPASDPRISVTANTFYLNDSGWFPTLMGFKAFFSPAVVRPDPTTLSVIIPGDFRVTASGEPHGEKKQNSETEYRYRIRKDDFNPYVAAGQYNEQRVSSDGVTVAIWTLEPISSQDAQGTARQIASAVKFYTQGFGTLPKNLKAIYDVESSENAGVSHENPRDWEDSILPGEVDGWIYDSRKGFERSLSNGFGSFFATIALANTWFGHIVQPRREAWMLSLGFASYASNALNEATNNIVQRENTVSTLQDYDGDRANAVEKSIISLTPADPQDQLQIGGDKINLFFFALEDKCGQQNVTHAIAHMVYALRGQQYGYSDFRAALEQECHQNLSDFFDVWLRQKGIPADFRARYESAKGNNAKP